ncbi:MAG: hypothetical protein AM1032_000348 [Mycoplasmataceae bacterium]|nr:MAG: hypothetical protein AM1032_000348 [Mycoplasmataceae bacterium]
MSDLVSFLSEFSNQFSNIDFDNLYETFDNFKNCNHIDGINLIDQNYPINGKCILKSSDNFGKLRSQIKFLGFKSINIEDLNLINFINLNKLNCSKNNLIRLNLNDCIKLCFLYSSKNKLIEVIFPIKNKISIIHLWENNLKSLNYERLNRDYLTKLYISNNNLEDNISVFSDLLNLEVLHFDNNNFYGSLKPLNKLKKLKKISFYNNKNIVPSFDWLNNNVIIYYKDEFKDLNFEECLYLNISLSNFTLIKNLDLKLKKNVNSSLLKFLKQVEIKMEKYVNLNLLGSLKLKISNKSTLNKDDLNLLLYTKFKRLQFKFSNNLRLEENDFKVLYKFVKLKEEDIKKIKNLQLKEDFLSLVNLNQYELMKDNLLLLNNIFKWKEGSNCLRKVQLINEILFNHNNGFILWLENKLIKIRKSKTNFYWNLIKHEEQTNNQQFEQFYNQIF